MLNNLTITKGAALAALLTLSATCAYVGTARTSMAPVSDTWELRLETPTDVYVLDSGLTLGDCWEEMQQPQGKGTSCVRAGR